MSHAFSCVKQRCYHDKMCVISLFHIRTPILLFYYKMYTLHLWYTSICCLYTQNILALAKRQGFRTLDFGLYCNKNLPLIAMSDGSLMHSLQSNQLMRSPSSDNINTVGVTLSTATIRPSAVTANPATISMNRT